MEFQWLSYMQFLDSALPVGGFAHSFGLETMVQTGRMASSDQLKQYIQTMLLHSWSTSDAMAVKAVYVYGGPQSDLDSIWRIDQMLHASRAAVETRDGQHKMGKRLLQLATAVYPAASFAPLQEAIRQRRCPGTHPLVHGWLSQQLGVPLALALEGYLYTCTVTCINSALRLMSMGQTEGQQLLATLLPTVREAARKAEGWPVEEPCTSTIAAEIDMMNHETLYSRLFMS